MKIIVRSKEEHLRLCLWFPTRLICNNLMALVISKGVAMGTGMQISSAEIKRLFQAIHQSKRKMKHQYLVDVESKNGDIVKIKL